MLCAPYDISRKRILFVDDEPALLAGLENLLRRDRTRWEMVFVLGGHHALDEIRRYPFDAVVSDMRMPDSDGATLLTIVQAEQPATVRIMLTGYADDVELARVRPVLHQLLTKPCRVAALREAIERNLDTHPEMLESTRP
jgi:DNA-binding NtrC family response regulator